MTVCFYCGWMYGFVHKRTHLSPVSVKLLQSQVSHCAFNQDQSFHWWLIWFEQNWTDPILIKWISDCVNAVIEWLRCSTLTDRLCIGLSFHLCCFCPCVCVYMCVCVCTCLSGSWHVSESTIFGICCWLDPLFPSISSAEITSTI